MHAATGAVAHLVLLQSDLSALMYEQCDVDFLFFVFFTVVTLALGAAILPVVEGELVAPVIAGGGLTQKFDSAACAKAQLVRK